VGTRTDYIGRVTFGLLALLVAAGLVGPLVSALAPAALPVVIGEIAAGVALGTTGAGWLDPTEPTVAFLARIGFALLMFVAGTHVPLRSPALRTALRKGLVAAVATGIAATAAALAIAPLTGIQHPAVLALPLATSSAAIVLPLLTDAGDSPPALTALAWVAIADVATIATLPFALAPDRLGRVAFGSVLVTALALVVLVVASRVRTSRAVHALRNMSRAHEWALDLRLSVLVLAVLAYAADRSGTSTLVAGFSAGLIVASVGEPRRLARQVRGLAHGFLVPVFFVVLGARLDLRALVSHPANLALMATLVAASVLAHLVGALAIRAPIAIGLAASAALGVPAAVVELGLTKGLIDAGQGGAIVGAALVSIGVSALGASRLPKAPAAEQPDRAEPGTSVVAAAG
jgi:Kef-type K+ transport system membrane component KefB